MRNNPDDLANQLISSIVEWLENEVENTELTEKILCESDDDDFIHFGRHECAESLLNQIKEWQGE